MEAEMGPQALENWQPPEAGEAWTDSPRQPQRKRGPDGTLISVKSR